MVRSGLRRMLHAQVWSDYYRFPINLHWYLQFIYWKMEFWCCPGVGHLHPILKPHRGVFVCTPSPTVGHLQLFQNKMTNAREMPGGMGTLGIDWAINNANLILIPSRALCTERRHRSYNEIFPNHFACNTLIVVYFTRFFIFWERMNFDLLSTCNEKSVCIKPHRRPKL